MADIVIDHVTKRFANFTAVDDIAMSFADGEVACLLGYQDASSFYRAFREWEGTTPNRWRALNFDGSKPSGSDGFLH